MEHRQEFWLDSVHVLSLVRPELLASTKDRPNACAVSGASVYAMFRLHLCDQLGSILEKWIAGNVLRSKGELRFVYKSRQDYDGLDFCAVSSESIVQFDFQPFGKIIYNMFLQAPDLKYSPAVPFTFSVGPRIDD